MKKIKNFEMGNNDGCNVIVSAFLSVSYVTLGVLKKDEKISGKAIFGGEK